MRAYEFIKQGVTEAFDDITFKTKRRKLNVPALIKSGAIFVTYPHSKDGWETDNKEDWAYSLISLYNVLQGGWPSESKKYLKPESYKRAEQQINSSAPNLGSDRLVYDGKYNQILWSIKKLGIPDNVAFLDEQGVTEDTVDEMALKSYTPLGKFDKPGPFKDPDYKLVVHPKHIEKVTTFFERVPQDFRMFMSNLPGKTKYRESGEKTPEEIKQIFGDKIAAEILKDTENAITIIYLGNYGLNRQIMNSWQIAHRVGHAITATGRYSRDGEIIEWKALDQYFFNQLNNMLQRYYGVETRGWSPEHRQQLNKQQKALIYKIGVQRSSRERNLNTTYEFLYEMLALYIKTGSVRLNPLPEYAGYGRQVGWKKEHKSFERYLRLRPEYRDEGFRKHVTEQLARELTSMFNGILDACVGRVFVM